MMPGKNGWQVLEELKENKKTKDIPVIIFSIMEDKQVAFNLGAFPQSTPVRGIMRY